MQSPGSLPPKDVAASGPTGPGSANRWGSQKSAHDFYRRKIEEQEKYLPELHDAAAARAVLEEVNED